VVTNNEEIRTNITEKATKNVFSQFLIVPLEWVYIVFFHFCLPGENLKKAVYSQAKGKNKSTGSP